MLDSVLRSTTIAWPSPVETAGSELQNADNSSLSWLAPPGAASRLTSLKYLGISSKLVRPAICDGLLESCLSRDQADHWSRRTLSMPSAWRLASAVTLRSLYEQPTREFGSTAVGELGHRLDTKSYDGSQIDQNIPLAVAETTACKPIQ